MFLHESKIHSYWVRLHFQILFNLYGNGFGAVFDQAILISVGNFSVFTIMILSLLTCFYCFEVFLEKFQIFFSFFAAFFALVFDTYLWFQFVTDVILCQCCFFGNLSSRLNFWKKFYIFLPITSFAEPIPSTRLHHCAQITCWDAWSVKNQSQHIKQKSCPLSGLTTVNFDWFCWCFFSVNVRAAAVQKELENKLILVRFQTALSSFQPKKVAKAPRWSSNYLMSFFYRISAVHLQTFDSFSLSCFSLLRSSRQLTDVEFFRNWRTFSNGIWGSTIKWEQWSSWPVLPGRCELCLLTRFERLLQFSCGIFQVSSVTSGCWRLCRSW